MASRFKNPPGKRPDDSQLAVAPGASGFEGRAQIEHLLMEGEVRMTVADYANAVKHMVRLCRRIAETKGLLSTGQPTDLDAAFAALAEAETERAARWETVLLLGEPATISAARAWSEQVWQLERILRDDHPDASLFIDAYRHAMRLRNEFYAHARTDLDITSGPLPELTWRSLEPPPPSPDH